jgi:hypothetical protein
MTANKMIFFISNSYQYEHNILFSQLVFILNRQGAKAAQSGNLPLPALSNHKPLPFLKGQSLAG